MTPRLDGAVAQLGERRVRNAEVRGSTPLGSTSPPDALRNIVGSGQGGQPVIVIAGLKRERETAGGVKNRPSPVELTAGYALPEADLSKVFARARPTRALARATKSRL